MRDIRRRLGAALCCLALLVAHTPKAWSEGMECVWEGSVMHCTYTTYKFHSGFWAGGGDWNPQWQRHGIIGPWGYGHTFSPANPSGETRKLGQVPEGVAEKIDVYIAALETAYRDEGEVKIANTLKRTGLALQKGIISYDMVIASMNGDVGALGNIVYEEAIRFIAAGLLAATGVASGSAFVTAVATIAVAYLIQTAISYTAEQIALGAASIAYQWNTEMDEQGLGGQPIGVQLMCMFISHSPGGHGCSFQGSPGGPILNP